MTLMVQDLSNPMLAQVPHVLLAAHAGTIMGVESNGMQFYPAASLPEAAVHPGLFRRRKGRLDLSTIHGPGFGYRLDEIERTCRLRRFPNPEVRLSGLTPITRRPEPDLPLTANSHPLLTPQTTCLRLLTQTRCLGERTG